MKIKEVIILMLAGFAIAMIDMWPVNDDLAKDQSLYCEMVKTFKETNGQYGWPDYRGNAAEVCK